jgi:hypothetical protein
MANPNLIYDPPTGHEDTTVFPTNPAKETVRGLMQRLHNQTRDFINNTLIVWINEIFAKKTDILAKVNTDAYTPTTSYNPATKKYVDDTAFSKSIPLDSVTDDYLSSLPGNIKGTVNAHMADNIQQQKRKQMGVRI